MTPEGRVKAAIDKLLKEHKAYAHKPVQNGMGKPALDYWVCHKGRFIAIEAKAPGEHMTDRQVRTAYEVIAAGGSMYCIDNINSIDFAELTAFLMEPGFRQAVGSNWIHESDLYKARRKNDESRDDRLGDAEHSE